MMTVLFSMKYDKIKIILIGTITMMWMHIMSVGLGTIIYLIIPKIIVIYISLLWFIFFAGLMFYDAYHM